MPLRLEAALTTCHIAFDVIPSPQILPSLLILRNIIPSDIPAAAAFLDILWPGTVTPKAVYGGHTAFHRVPGPGNCGG